MACAAQRYLFLEKRRKNCIAALPIQIFGSFGNRRYHVLLVSLDRHLQRFLKACFEHCAWLKAADLRAAGKDPYAYTFNRTHMAKELHELFQDLPNGQQAETTPVSVAGRVKQRRVLGKLAFISIEDDSGSIQLYIDKKQLDDAEEGAFK